MRFPKKDQKETIIYNSKIMVSNIPAKAYEYVSMANRPLDGSWNATKSPPTKKEASAMTPNDWGDEVGNPRYILDLLLSIINVSMQTVEIVEGMPKVNFE